MTERIIIHCPVNDVDLQVNSDGSLVTCPESHHTSFGEEYTADAGGDIAATAIITPTSGKKLSLHVIHLDTEGASGSIQLDYVTSGVKVLRMYPLKAASSDFSMTHDEGAVDEVLTLTAIGIGGGTKVFIKIQYVEE